MIRIILGVLVLIALVAWIASRFVQIVILGFGPLDIIIIIAVLCLGLWLLGKL